MSGAAAGHSIQAAQKAGQRCPAFPFGEVVAASRGLIAAPLIPDTVDGMGRHAVIALDAGRRRVLGYERFRSRLRGWAMTKKKGGPEGPPCKFVFPRVIGVG